MPRAVDLLDGHLLRVLATVVEERSVSRAAQRLAQTQPAVSGSLKRLREILGDALLVRDGTSMVPTARAIELAVQARRALAAMEALVARPGDFVPHEAELRFRIATADYIAPSWIAALAQRIGAEAPQCRLELRALGPTFDFERALADDELDLVIGNWPTPPEHLHISLLLDDDLVVLLARNHPLAAQAQIDEANYLAAGHVVPVPYAMTQRGVVESHLAERRLVRDARVRVPYFGMAPAIAAASPWLFTTARHFAEYHARLLPLAVCRAPEGFPPMRFYQLWHERAHHAAAHRWLRGLVTQIVRGQATSGAPSANATLR